MNTNRAKSFIVNPKATCHITR